MSILPVALKSPLLKTYDIGTFLVTPFIVTPTLITPVFGLPRSRLFDLISTIFAVIFLELICSKKNFTSFSSLPLFLELTLFVSMTTLEPTSISRKLFPLGATAVYFTLLKIPPTPAFAGVL
uniref:Uncharacterized protein n=1 Tax=uncultured microorganism TaxID=358574 RepID=L8B179_9ZZZZ|nr:hypothetical protein [uncultured microorganism]